jgi:hypothetical protein
MKGWSGARLWSCCGAFLTPGAFLLCHVYPQRSRSEDMLRYAPPEKEKPLHLLRSRNQAFLFYCALFLLPVSLVYVYRRGLTGAIISKHTPRHPLPPPPPPPQPPSSSDASCRFISFFQKDETVSPCAFVPPFKYLLYGHLGQVGSRICNIRS